MALLRTHALMAAVMAMSLPRISDVPLRLERDCTLPEGNADMTRQQRRLLARENAKERRKERHTY